MGIKKQNLKVTDEAIRKIIEDYTAESGVRGLKKQMDTLCRSAAVRLVRGDQKSVTVSEKRLAEFLGRSEMHHDRVPLDTVPGVVTGLAWTMAGGEILFIETAMTQGEGSVKITGQLGDVMKESAQIAITLVKSMYPEESKVLEERELHIHVPSGAVPKDGPSAGYHPYHSPGFPGDRKEGQPSDCHDRRGFSQRRRDAHRRTAGEIDGRPAGRRPQGIHPLG